MKYPSWRPLARSLPPVAVLFALVGCCGSFQKPLSVVKANIPKDVDIAVILIEPDLTDKPDPKQPTVYADRFAVKAKIHIVFWIADADTLEIQPKIGGIDVRCFKSFCYTVTPFPPVYQTFKYTATVTCKNKQPQTVDPTLEVVP